MNDSDSIVRPDPPGWTRRAERRRTVFNVIIVLQQLALIIIAVYEIFPRLDKISMGIDMLSDANLIRIYHPRPGEDVDISGNVIGKTTFSGLLHYVLVTINGEDHLQSEGERVFDDGLFVGAAHYGTAASCGREFILRVFATEVELAPRTFDGMPPDAVVSEPVVVTRPPCS